ncbi:MAG TPA: SDR family oxidoreductase [Acidobacteriaceae bacterium]
MRVRFQQSRRNRSRERCPLHLPAEQLGTNPSKRLLKKMIPTGRLGTADELASATMFLASDQSSFITRTDLLVDGATVSR